MGTSDETRRKRCAGIAIEAETFAIAPGGLCPCHVRMKNRAMAEPKRAFHGSESYQANGSESYQAKGRRGGKRQALKRAVNVSIDASILSVAKDMKINLSEVLETALSDLTAEERARRFYMEHKAAIDSYNRLVECHGTLSEAFYGRNVIERDVSSV